MWQDLSLGLLGVCSHGLTTRVVTGRESQTLGFLLGIRPSLQGWGLEDPEKGVFCSEAFLECWSSNLFHGGTVCILDQYTYLQSALANQECCCNKG